MNAEVLEQAPIQPSFELSNRTPRLCVQTRPLAFGFNRKRLFGSTTLLPRKPAHHKTRARRPAATEVQRRDPLRAFHLVCAGRAGYLAMGIEKLPDTGSADRVARPDSGESDTLDHMRPENA